MAIIDISLWACSSLLKRVSSRFPALPQFVISTDTCRLLHLDTDLCILHDIYVYVLIYEFDISPLFRVFLMNLLLELPLMN